MTADDVSELGVHATGRANCITSNCIETQRKVLIDLVKSVSISPTTLILELGHAVLFTQTFISAKKIAGDIITLTYPLQMKRRSVETKLIAGGVALRPAVPEIISMITKVRYWYEGHKTQSEW